MLLTTNVCMRFRCCFLRTSDYHHSFAQISPQDQMEIIAKLHTELDRRGLLEPEHDVYTLHRFLRARKFNLDETVAMFERVQVRSRSSIQRARSMPLNSHDRRPNGIG